MNPFTKFVANLLNKSPEEVEKEQYLHHLGHEPTAAKSWGVPHRGVTKSPHPSDKQQKARRKMEAASRKRNRNRN